MRLIAIKYLNRLTALIFTFKFIFNENLNDTNLIIPFQYRESYRNRNISQNNRKYIFFLIS